MICSMGSLIWRLLEWLYNLVCSCDLYEPFSEIEDEEDFAGPYSV